VETHYGSREQSEMTYAESFGKYEAAAILEPQDFQTFFNWGNAIYRCAKGKAGQGRVEEVAQALCVAGDKYARAVWLNGECREALQNWCEVVHLLDSLPLSSAQSPLLSSLLSSYFRTYMTSTKGVENSFLNLMADMQKLHNPEAKALFRSFASNPNAFCFSAQMPQPTARAKEETQDDENEREKTEKANTLPLPSERATGENSGGMDGKEKTLALSDPQIPIRENFQATFVLPNFEAVSWRGETILLPPTTK